MKVRWKILLASMVIWLVEEISLNLAGLDDFADYSEFLQDKCKLCISINTYPFVVKPGKELLV